MEAHGSRHGMPSEPPRDPTGAHVVFHGRPWGPMGAHDSCHRSPRPPTGPHEKTAGGHYSYHRGMYIVFQRALVGVPVATPTEPKWEPTRHVMAARVGAHVAAHMAAHVACRKQWIKKNTKTVLKASVVTKFPVFATFSFLVGSDAFEWFSARTCFLQPPWQPMAA